MVIDANLVPAIVDALARAEFRTQKEAAWAVSNFTVGGTPEQVSLSSFPSPPPFLCMCVYKLCVCVCVMFCINVNLLAITTDVCTHIYFHNLDS